MQDINARLYCGHWAQLLASGEEGTNYCIGCELVAKERERCAKIAETAYFNYIHYPPEYSVEANTHCADKAALCTKIAKKIRETTE